MSSRGTGTFLDVEESAIGPREKEKTHPTEDEKRDDGHRFSKIGLNDPRSRRCYFSARKGKREERGTRRVSASSTIISRTFSTGKTPRANTLD